MLAGPTNNQQSNYQGKFTSSVKRGRTYGHGDNDDDDDDDVNMRVLVPEKEY